MNRIIVLGGGFGGLATAHSLRRLRPDDEIMLVDRNSHFMVGFRKTWALLGLSPMEVGQRPLAGLSKAGIAVAQGTIGAIDPAALAVEVDGRRLAADALVVALGAQLAAEQVPGFTEHALSVYDPATNAGAAKALHEFEGGRIVLGIFGPVYKCPPAPYEMALLLRDFLTRRGVRATIEVFTPQPMSLPILGSAGCDVIESRLAARGITFLPNRKALSVEVGQVNFAADSRPFDLLLGVPPHRCPDVVVASGLAGDGEWAQVDPQTLATRFAGVYAIGDVVEVAMANGKPLPKAGVFAEAQGQVVAQRIAAALAGQESAVTFDGRGGCFLEVGDGEAMMVSGEFLAEPAPRVQLVGPDAAYMAQKRDFEQERLGSWFGSPG